MQQQHLLLIFLLVLIIIILVIVLAVLQWLVLLGLFIIITSFFFFFSLGSLCILHIPLSKGIIKLQELMLMVIGQPHLTLHLDDVVI
jgi:hypothetical protein